MTLIGIVILGCWIILLLYWVIFAFFQKKLKEGQTLKSKIAYNLLLLMSYVLLLVSSKIIFLNYVLIKVSNVINILSLILSVSGLVLCIYSRIVLGSNWSRDVMIKEKHELITTGPYKYIRHPIYAGLLLLFFGTTLAIGNVGSILGFILLLVNFKIKIKKEENLMLKHFNRRYLNYMKRTGSIVPPLYSS